MWNFVLTDMAWNPIGEIQNAYDRKVYLPLNKIDSLSFSIRSNNSLFTTIMTCRCMIKAYRDGVLRFFGPVISAEEVGDSSGTKISVSAAGAGWVLSKRIHREQWSGFDRAVIAAKLIQRAEEPGILNYGGAYPTYVPNEIDGYGAVSAASSASYYPPESTSILDSITELSAGVSGFDWRILPREPYISTANFAGVPMTKIGLFVALPVIGTANPNAGFEIGPGTRNNVASYKRLVDRSTQANVAFSSVFGDENVLINQADVSDTDWRVLEEQVQSSLPYGALLDSLLTDHVTVRRQPRLLIDMQPSIDPSNSGRVPNFGVDYDLGDTISFVVAYGYAPTLTYSIRVWAATFDIDSNGSERTTLTLTNE